MDDTDIGDMAEMIRDDKDKHCKDSMLPISKKMTPKRVKQDEGNSLLFMEKAQALGFCFEERQKLFLLYGGHL